MTAVGGAADQHLGAFDLNNIYGKKALSSLYQDTSGVLSSAPELLSLYEGLSFVGAAGDGEASGRWPHWDDFAKEVRDSLWGRLRLREEVENIDMSMKLDECEAINRFLNRILMLDTEFQNAVFEAFYAVYMELVRVDKANGMYDDGVENLNQINGRMIRNIQVSERQVLYTDALTGAQTQYIRLVTDRGIQWKEAKATYDALPKGGGSIEGFYAFRHRGMSDHELPVYVLVKERERLGGAGNTGGTWAARMRSKQYFVWHADIGVTVLPGYSCAKFAADERYERVEDTEYALKVVEAAWEKQYASSSTSRLMDEHVLTGDVLTAWRLTNTEQPSPDGDEPKDKNKDKDADKDEIKAKIKISDDDALVKKRSLQVVRAITQPDGVPVVGMRVYEEDLPKLRYVLECQQLASEEKKQQQKKEKAATEQQEQEAKQQKKQEPGARSSVSDALSSIGCTDMALTAAELLLERLEDAAKKGRKEAPAAPDDDGREPDEGDRQVEGLPFDTVEKGDRRVEGLPFANWLDVHRELAKHSPGLRSADGLRGVQLAVDLLLRKKLIKAKKGKMWFNGNDDDDERPMGERLERILFPTHFINPQSVHGSDDEDASDDGEFRGMEVGDNDKVSDDGLCGDGGEPGEGETRGEKRSRLSAKELAATPTPAKAQRTRELRSEPKRGSQRKRRRDASANPNIDQTKAVQGGDGESADISDSKMRKHVKALLEGVELETISLGTLKKQLESSLKLEPGTLDTEVMKARVVATFQDVMTSKAKKQEKKQEKKERKEAKRAKKEAEAKPANQEAQGKELNNEEMARELFGSGSDSEDAVQDVQTTASAPAGNSRPPVDSDDEVPDIDVQAPPRTGNSRPIVDSDDEVPDIDITAPARAGSGAVTMDSDDEVPDIDISTPGRAGSGRAIVDSDDEVPDVDITASRPVGRSRLFSDDEDEESADDVAVKDGKSQQWTYQVVGNKIGIRAVPDVASAPSGSYLAPAEYFNVVERRRGEDGRTYLKLADGRGWAYDRSAKEFDKVVVREVAA
eukprot:gnl/TRDRNA2_/TRDRNA2_147216_c0_seq1.p1 gnl/TRDRNA2_/TRDRNA2_147216_c0~~gnl/TRDRNA2_/TRDRNA2_147216_c0_seq1.p1  ORF type:complete len:1174 (+),score=324.65 gnl/TRDRNA2_/TRDRNA2_147216_c0_seq1:427-3522(+)